METIKIQISEVEGMTVKIPTEFTAHSFNKFYDQMNLIAKAMPSNVLTVDPTPQNLKIGSWSDKTEALALLQVYTDEGKDASIVWIKENRDIVLTDLEVSKLSQLMAGIRCKYKKETSA